MRWRQRGHRGSVAASVASLPWRLYEYSQEIELNSDSFLCAMNSSCFCAFSHVESDYVALKNL